ncbi:ArsR family transcriptional regulator [Candidatus Woesearchaeota archaeon]|nr:ArsR family transcriptional regulator [Candidatus Woesearchaeota archaeon]
MRFSYTKITVVRINQEVPEQIDEELQWLGSSLGLFNLRDKDKSCYRIFISLLKHAKRKKAVSSDEVAYELSLTRGTVVHHLNKLINNNIVKITDGKYLLRASNLEELVELVKQDSITMFDDIKKVARNVDKKLR